MLCWGVLALGLIVASVYDIRARRVPNWLSVGLLTSGVVSRYLTSGPVEAGWGLAGSAVGLLLLLFPYSRSWIGGGDVKLLAATGSWLGPQLVLYAALFGSLAAGLISLGYLLRSPAEVRRQVLLNLKLTFMLKSVPEMPEAADRAHNLSPPLAPAIAIGTLATVCLYYVDLLLLYRI
jgi:prepilin peptidase CpaA